MAIRIGEFQVHVSELIDSFEYQPCDFHRLCFWVKIRGGWGFVDRVIEHP